MRPAGRAFGNTELLLYLAEVDAELAQVEGLDSAPGAGDLGPDL